MTIEIDLASPVPLYQQIHDRIVEAIAAGRLATGESLVPVRTLAESFGINPATVVKAYDLLKQDGLVQANRKAGSVVVADPSGDRPSPEFLDDWSGRARTLAAEAVARGATGEEVVELLRGVLGSLTAASHVEVAR